jgi:hypothetical protein
MTEKASATSRFQVKKLCNNSYFFETSELFTILTMLVHIQCVTAKLQRLIVISSTRKQWEQIYTTFFIKNQYLSLKCHNVDRRCLITYNNMISTFWEKMNRIHRSITSLIEKPAVSYKNEILKPTL